MPDHTTFDNLYYATLIIKKIVAVCEIKIDEHSSISGISRNIQRCIHPDKVIQKFLDDYKKSDFTKDFGELSHLITESLEFNCYRILAAMRLAIKNTLAGLSAEDGYSAIIRPRSNRNPTLQYGFKLFIKFDNNFTWTRSSLKTVEREKQKIKPKNRH